MTRRKSLNPDETSNLLRELAENESDGGELSCSNLHFDEDIRLSESDYEESEKVQILRHLQIEIDDPASNVVVQDIFWGLNQGIKNEVEKRWFSFSPCRCLKHALTLSRRELFNVFRGAGSLWMSRAFTPLNTFLAFSETSIPLQILH
ncbi:hypothetical protein TNCV_1801411 [Trichonephila clavipes]|nr:hypothetical protein TNCV_1801411 [Trichonephila clavipes]